MRPAFIAAGLLALGLGGFFAGRYRTNFEVNSYALVPRSVEENAAEGLRMGLSPVQVGSLRALVRRPPTSHAWLLYWGGNAHTYFKDAVDTVQGFQLPPEIGVLIVAPPGYDSSGHPSPEGLGRDAVAARGWLRATQGAQRIVVGGFSMGTFSALAAADQDVVGLVLLGVSSVMEAGDPSPWIRFREPVRYRYRPGPAKVPTLLLQGELDEPEDGALVAGWLGAPLTIVPGARHQDTRTHPTALREASAFIQSLLVQP